jgi:hypothetical protein
MQTNMQIARGHMPARDIRRPLVYTDRLMYI